MAENQTTPASKPVLVRKGADLYDADGRRAAWFVLNAERVYVEGQRTAAELRAIADWMEGR